MGVVQMNDSTSVFEVRLNGESHPVHPGTTVAALIEELAIESTAVAVERNRKIVPRSLHPSTVIEVGDELEVVTIVGGG
jgi:thiamine biosynthesis protein ThiS